MAPIKRKRASVSFKKQDEPSHSDSDDSGGDDYEVVNNYDNNVDISSALTGGNNFLDDGDDDIDGLIKTQQDKRALKDGREALKRVVKGQNKQGGGVTGGGSFQSMGE